MEILYTFAIDVFAQMAANHFPSVKDWLVRTFWKKTKDANSREIQRLLEQLGNVSEATIRQLVERAALVHKVSKEDRDELIQLLINLSKNARFQTTNGTKLSTVVRCEELIEKLLSDIQPKRRKGEKVDSGSDWILDGFLGMGGFGEVWRAKNPLFPDVFAFKFFTDPDAAEWLRKEGKVLYHVKDELGNHPNVINYLNIATQAAPYPYLSLQYANGGSLEDWILQLPSERKPLIVDEVIAGIIEGLFEAHQANIFHRDLKPANILLNYDDEGDVDELPMPLIADFGLSHADSSKLKAIGASSLGSRQIVVGTRMYLPPEATSYGGMNPAQQDIFALGVTWYQLLISKLERPPYDFADHLRRLGIDSRTIRLLSQCLAHPSRRFKDAVQLKETYHDLLPSPTWFIPDGCFDVGPLAAASFESDLMEK